MAASPEWKVYTPDGDYTACFKHPCDAAAFVAILGEGATIRHKGSRAVALWTEGKDGSAGESYDLVAQRCYDMVRERAVEAANKRLDAIEKHAARYGSV